MVRPWKQVNIKTSIWSYSDDNDKNNLILVPVTSGAPGHFAP